jgi:3-oxoacyl-[acyl-carrier protein] reductase
MDLDLRDKKALVLGSTSGIGRGIAAALIAEGARVAIASRSKERADEVAGELGAAAGVAADLEAPGAGEAVVNAAIDALDGIDILVTNCGGPPKGPFLAIDDEAWERGFRGVWMSAVGAIRAALPPMIAEGFGRIILITSSTGREPIENLTLSNGLRPGLHGLANSIADEVAADGVTVNAIMPGTIDTGRLAELGMSRDDLVAAIPARRLGDVSEIGALAAFLASRQAAYITGQAIAVDGGRMRGI